jgi:hypothetical protein
MRRTFSLIATAAFALSLASGAQAAQCKDPTTGKFVKCPAASAATTPAAGGYTLDAKGKCHDAKGKMAKKSLCAGASSAAATPTAPSAASAGQTTKTTTMAAATGGATSTAAPTASATAKGPPHCTKGKPCGNACIAKDKICHK